MGMIYILGKAKIILLIAPQLNKVWQYMTAQNNMPLYIVIANQSKEQPIIIGININKMHMSHSE